MSKAPVRATSRRTTASSAAERRWRALGTQDPPAARALLIEAARRCYRKLGVHRVRMQDIAHAARVGRATLYRYFPNRTAILLAVFRVEIQSVNDRFRKRHPEPGEFCTLFLDYLVFVGSQPHQQRTGGRNLDDTEMLWVARTLLNDDEALRLTAALFEEPFQRSLAAGELHDDLQLPELIRFAARVLVSFVLLPGHREQDPAELESLLRRLVIRALRKQGR